MKPKLAFIKGTYLFLAGFWGAVFSDLQAATVIWTGGQGGPALTWSWKNNWSGSGNSGPVSGDNLVFAGTNKLVSTNDLAAGTSLAGILFDTNAGPFVLNGNAITLTGNVTNNSTNLQTLNLGITLSTNTVFAANSGDLDLGGVVSGTGGFIKSGANSLTLRTANTYSGGTTIREGAVTLSGAGTLGTTNGALAIAAGTLNLGGLTRTNGSFALDTGILTNGTLIAASFSLTNAGTIAAVLAGNGALTKSGLGATILSGANTYSGGTTVQSGTLILNRAGNGTGGTVAGTISIRGGTLLLGQANQISDSSAIFLAGGSIDTAGFADHAGALTVTADSSIRGLVASTGGGVATSSDFLFSGVNLSNYATGSGGGILNLGAGYAAGATINFARSDFAGWVGYSPTSLNNFTDKIMFGDAGLKAQISFNATTGLTYLTAVPVPEPGVSAAAALLVVLTAIAEYKRRKR